MYKGTLLDHRKVAAAFVVFCHVCAVRMEFPQMDGDLCFWTKETAVQDYVSFTCNVRNIERMFTNSNFTSLHPDSAMRVRVNCTGPRHDDNSRTLTTHTLGHLRNLRELSISNCKMRTIPSHVFSGLSQMRNLTINTGNVEWGDSALELLPETFSQLQLLERLDLSRNNIASLPQTLLCPLRHLLVLNVSQNDFSDVPSVGLSAGSRENALCLVDVEKVYLSRNRIRVLTSKGFAALSQLRELYLDNNAISRAEDSAFRGLDKLRVLDLSGNQIVALPPTVLRPCEELSELHLQNNSISVLPPGLLSGLQQLLLLDLSRNEITSHWLGSETFSDLIRLVMLNLSRNRLTQIDSSIFRNQLELQILYLDHNAIETIADHAFSSLQKLHTLLLNNNKLSTISSWTFSNLRALSMLSLQQNNIYFVQTDAFQNNSALMELSFAANRLLDVPLAVQSLQSLRSLDMSSNLITDVHNASYLGLEHLYSLALSGNRIGNLTKGVFEDLPSLRILNLANNDIHWVEPGTFDDILYLHALRLDSNFLTDVNGLFNNLHDLLMLNISANRIAWFDYALVPIGIQWLDLHDNQIEHLGNYFEMESVLKLRTLDASRNHIEEIDSSSLPNGIEIVFLNENHIKLIHPFTFMGKPNLTRVDLTGNMLQTLEVNAFRLTEVNSRRPLPEFSVSENPYQCDCNMEWIQRMDTLDESRQYPRIVDIEDIACQMSFNRNRAAVPIINAHSSQFLCRYKNHCFALCHCCEFDACDCEMVCPGNCTCFYDQSWNTNIVDCGLRNHTAVPRRIPMDVTELYLDGNDIPSLSSHTFIGRKNMRVLFLNNSNVHVINNRTFNGLRSLQSLYLHRNRLVVLHGYEFERLANLRELFLSHNCISYVGNTTFTHLRSLQVLHLDHNCIKEFQVWNLNQNNRLASIQLSQNPWVCECQFVSDFSYWLQSRSRLVHDLYSVRCVYNDSTSVALTEYNTSVCTDVSVASPSYVQSSRSGFNEFLPVFILVASLFLLLILAIVLAFVYRKKMTIWFFARYGVRIFNSGKEAIEEQDKLFDAFVSYSKKDESFVGQVFAPELECGDPHYRLCLHYRDLPVSGYLTDAVVEAIESSRRTIVILSENFIRSEWCRYEFKSAHHEVLRTSKHRLIVILIGTLSQRDMDADMRLWLKTSVVLKWGDKRFWEKLRFALPDIRRRRTSRKNVDHSISVHI